MDSNINLENIINAGSFKKSFFLTFYYTLTGLVLLSIFLIIADNTLKRSFFYYFSQNAGIFFLFVSLLTAYSGVHRINTGATGNDIGAWKIFISTFKKAHYVLAVTLIVILSIGAIAAAELGISMISYIPYAGPIIIILLTIPMLIINLGLLVTAISVIILAPPMIGEDKNFNGIIRQIIGLLKKKGLYIITYILISLIIFYLFLKAVYMITGYSTGLTKAMQWQVNIAYPVMVENFVLYSYVTDILQKIGPAPGTLLLLRKYGFEILDYVSLVKYSTGIFFYAAFAFIFSFPFALYFTVLSGFYKRVRE